MVPSLSAQSMEAVKIGKDFMFSHGYIENDFDARVNGPMFLAGRVVALGIVSAVAYAPADAGDAATDSTASDTVSWGTMASASSSS